MTLLLPAEEVGFRVMVVAARAALVISGSKLSGRQSWRLLWESSRPLSLGVLAWAAADAVDGPLIIAALLVSLMMLRYR
jgi:hypothetical protein